MSSDKPQWERETPENGDKYAFRTTHPKLTERISIGPFSVFFTNINREMKLAGHSHFAELHLTFETLSTIGFPVFAPQYEQIKQEIQKLTKLPFRDHTNEKVSREIFAHFDTLVFVSADPAIYRLHSIKLRVRGVPDSIGHGDGFAEYEVSRG